MVSNRVIAVSNLKGGVGKTTISWNLLYEIIECYENDNLLFGGTRNNPYRIAGLDLDANQNNLMHSLFEYRWNGSSNFKKSKMNGRLILEGYCTLHIPDLFDFSKPNISQYKYIVIDTPPSLSLVESKIRHYVTDLIIPINERYSQEGLESMKILLDALPEKINVFIIKYNCSKDGSFDSKVLKAIEKFLDYALKKRNAYTNVNKNKIMKSDHFTMAENTGVPVILNPTANRIKVVREFAVFLDKVILFGAKK